MSDFWSWYIIIIVTINLGGCAWLLLLNRNMTAEEAAKETTGHSFDGIEERNQPLPRWWLWLFVATLIFACIYLALYPGLGKYKGLLGWTSHKQWQQEVDLMHRQTDPLFKQYAAVPIKQLINYPEVMAVGSRLFSQNCAVCHGSDARGARGFPNLTDDDWLFGGTPEDIKTTITNGRVGMMPPMGAAIGGPEEVRKMALYVASLSRPEIMKDPQKAKMIEEVKPKFAVCAACHGQDAKGNQMIGSANLTDNIWLFGGDLKTIEETITNGRHTRMPAQKDRLSPERIHVLAAYVYSLSHKPTQTKHLEETK